MYSDGMGRNSPSKKLCGQSPAALVHRPLNTTTYNARSPKTTAKPETLLYIAQNKNIKKE